ncbi:hypothetical protein BDZ89DRAFT_1115686 [Hymenopellis radicata]|nr:hypothetical protein BDZ89DRAFT_1115686 [Hymenopellis radicata]
MREHEEEIAHEDDRQSDKACAPSRGDDPPSVQQKDRNDESRLSSTNAGAYKFEPVNPYPPTFPQQSSPELHLKTCQAVLNLYPRHDHSSSVGHSRRYRYARRAENSATVLPPICLPALPSPPPPQHHGGYYDLPPSHPSSLHHMHHPHAAAYPPPPHPSSIVYTEDASTKLSDRVRRRCFNCCTTDTSTWRRSNLSPGKVLCNKCGLFERTHSRPRPEQFPHKRGPLSGGALSQQRGPDPGAYMMRGTLHIRRHP